MKHVEKQVVPQRLQQVCYFIVGNMAIFLENSFSLSKTFAAGYA